MVEGKPCSQELPFQGGLRLACRYPLRLFQLMSRGMALRCSVIRVVTRRKKGIFNLVLAN